MAGEPEPTSPFTLFRVRPDFDILCRSPARSSHSFFFFDCLFSESFLSVSHWGQVLPRRGDVLFCRQGTYIPPKPFVISAIFYSIAEYRAGFLEFPWSCSVHSLLAFIVNRPRLQYLVFSKPIRDQLMQHQLESLYIYIY